MTASDIIQQSFQKAQQTFIDFCQSEANQQQVNLLAQLMADTLSRGNTIITCGNGGSMCDAMHMAQELTGKFDQPRQSLAAIAISDAAYLSCAANDFGYQHSFSRFIEGMGRTGDLLVCLSTSGNSTNVVQAAKVAQQQGINVVGLLGGSGGMLADLVQLPIIVAGSDSADRIQEVHIKIIHVAIEVTEHLLLSTKRIEPQAVLNLSQLR